MYINPGKRSEIVTTQPIKSKVVRYELRHFRNYRNGGGHASYFNVYKSAWRAYLAACNLRYFNYDTEITKKVLEI